MTLSSSMPTMNAEALNDVSGASARKTVGVIASAEQDLRLFEWLGAIYPVRFERRTAANLRGLDGAVCLGSEGDHPPPPLPSLTFLGADQVDPVSGVVEFTNHTATPAILRGRSTPQDSSLISNAAPTKSAAAALAVSSGRPVWTMVETPAGRADFTACRLPQIDYYPSFFEYFNGGNFFNLLPLVDFVRRLAGEDQWTPAPLRGCFMFDDPNVHAAHYGHINYAKLVRHAEEHNYHASFATIPLDGWFTSRGSARFFLEHPQRLSLLIHGNDHLRNELASYATDAQALHSLAQALRRIAHIEKASGVPVSRVMAAPHGACTARSMEAMARLGYEAACISAGSLRLHNAPSDWTLSLGLRPTEMLAGFPIIPRFKMGRYNQGSILLAAYLGQPLVLMGHHEDAADGLALLAQLAESINALGPVQWADMRTIARGNFLLQRDDSELRMRPYSRRLQLAVPREVNRLFVELPEGTAASETLTVTDARERRSIYSGPAGSVVPVAPGTVLEILFSRADAIEPESLPDVGLNLRALGRRLLTEGRDRLVGLRPERTAKAA